jgi:23S rRNA pseudouridine2605 synthase
MSKQKNHPGRATDQARDAADPHPGGERLQKVLAAAGVGSRRGCEELITAGRIEVDRQVVTELGTRVDPVRQEIRVDGEVIKQPKSLYYAVNKPMGVVTTNFDPAGRARVIDLVPTEQRVFAVGRLDRSSEGLILVTNDGEFANRITHPRYGVEKTYLVRVAGTPSEAELAKLRKGVYLSDGFVRAQSVIEKSRHGQSTDLLIVLNEGRNREIRRILARVGHKVLRLKRIAVGPIKLADLPVGNWRRLMPPEIDALLAASKQKQKRAKRAPARSRSEGKQDVGPARSASDASGEEDLSPVDAPRYVRQDALLAEPLSLDDLLRDDLDEGGPIDSDASEASVATDFEQYSFEDGPAGRPAGVIDFEADEEATGEPEGPLADASTPQPPAKQPSRGSRERRGFGASGGGRERKPFGRKPVGNRPSGNRPAGNRRSGNRPFEKRRSQGERAGEGERGEEREALPRESYGRNRSGRRVYSPPHEGRGPAGETAGNFRFRNKSQLRGERNRTRPEGAPLAEGEPVGEGEGPRKRFAKAGGKKFARPAGNRPGGKGGKKFAKPGGRRFGKGSEGPKPSKRGGARFEKPSGGKPGKRGSGKKGRR